MMVRIVTRPSTKQAIYSCVHFVSRGCSSNPAHHFKSYTACQQRMARGIHWSSVTVVGIKYFEPRCGRKGKRRPAFFSTWSNQNISFSCTAKFTGCHLTSTQTHTPASQLQWWECPILLLPSPPRDCQPVPHGSISLPHPYYPPSQVCRRGK